jgi:hypothetical protein
MHGKTAQPDREGGGREHQLFIGSRGCELENEINPMGDFHFAVANSLFVSPLPPVVWLSSMACYGSQSRDGFKYSVPVVAKADTRLRHS